MLNRLYWFVRDRAWFYVLAAVWLAWGVVLTWWVCVLIEVAVG